MTRYVIVDQDGDWVELDSSQIVVEVEDEWYQENINGTFLFDMDCENYVAGESDGMVNHWHVQDLLQPEITK